MGRFINGEFAEIIGRIPDQTYNVNEILEAFRKSIAELATVHEIIYYKAFIAEPFNFRANKPGDVTELALFDNRNGLETENYVVRFEIGSGGYVEVTSGIAGGKVWTDDAKSDCFILAKTIFLLFGRARAMNALVKMSFYDGLTGIPNVTMLNQVIGKTFQNKSYTEYCSNFLNIKNMKLLNNRYTQAVGDKIITAYSQKLMEYLGDEGTIARMGGDNFVVYLKKDKENEFLKYIRDLEVDVLFPDGSMNKVRVESRVGYYYLDEKSEPVDVIRNCDMALNCAKNDKEMDTVLFCENMKTRILRIKQLEENIPVAIENCEFQIYYQPKADISVSDDYKLIGAEALVRWFKDGALIPPNEFIPILEKNGMVTLIDFFVFESVCQAIVGWQEQGLEPVRVSSNFSRRHLFDENFADKIEDIIRKYNIDPKYLEIEITESYDNDDVYALKQFERRMHEIGIHLSVDDFGSGFSSLKMLKNIVSDTVKLDKSIIDDIGAEDDGNDIIVKHIIQMLSCLGKEIIAEGVEYEHQAEFLRQNGCKMIQGYLFGKPVSKMDFDNILAKANVS